jgi:hypothetical protein
MNSSKKLNLSPSKKQILALRDRYVDTDINMLLHETITSVNTNNNMMSSVRTKEDKAQAAPALNPELRVAM